MEPYATVMEDIYEPFLLPKVICEKCVRIIAKLFDVWKKTEIFRTLYQNTNYEDKCFPLPPVLR